MGSIKPVVYKSVLLIIVLVFFVSTATAEKYRLGLSAPLSGGGAAWGNDVKNVLQFANEKLADGKYSLVFEDDRCDPKTSLSVARKLTSVDKVKATFIVCGQATLAATKAYRDKGVTVIATLATPSRISDLGAFRTSLNDAFAAQMLAEYVVKFDKNVTVLTEENDYPISFLEDFLRSAKKLNLKVDEESYLAKQQDFRSLLLRFKKKKVTALFLNTQTEEALSTLLKQLKEIEFAPRLYGAYLPGSEHFLEIGGELAEGMVFIDFPGAEDMLTAEGQELYKEYLARFGPLQGWSYAFPATFEAFRVVQLGIEHSLPLESFLRVTKFDGLIGSYSFNEKGDIIGPKHVLRIVRDGRSKLLNEAANKKIG